MGARPRPGLELVRQSQLITEYRQLAQTPALLFSSNFSHFWAHPMDSMSIHGHHISSFKGASSAVFLQLWLPPGIRRDWILAYPAWVSKKNMFNLSTWWNFKIKLVNSGQHHYLIIFRITFRYSTFHLFCDLFFYFISKPHENGATKKSTLFAM